MQGSTIVMAKVCSIQNLNDSKKQLERLLVTYIKHQPQPQDIIFKQFSQYHSYNDEHKHHC